MGDFVDLPFTTDSTTLINNAVSALQAEWPGWSPTPDDGDVAFIQIETLAPMAVNAVTQASNMPQAALIGFGEQLLGIPYGTGTSAYTTVRMTLQDNAGYTVQAGGQINIDNYAFQITDGGTTTPGGATTLDLLVASTELTSDANGLTGASALSSISIEAWVTGFQVLSPTTGGSDPQTDDEYADQVSRDRRLSTAAVITDLDYEIAALDVDGITRARAETDASRDVTITALDSNGLPIGSVSKTDLLNYYANLRQWNVEITFVDATRNFVIVIYSVVSESGIDAGSLQAAINTALATELSPLGWGLPSTGDAAASTWENETTIYVSRLATVISQVPGVYRVVSVKIGQEMATLSAALVNTAPITTMSITAATIAILNGDTFYLAGAAGSQAWVASGNPGTPGQVAIGATSIKVASQTPNANYPVGTGVFRVGTGDVLMTGTVPLPSFIASLGTVASL